MVINNSPVFFALDSLIPKSSSKNSLLSINLSEVISLSKEVVWNKKTNPNITPIERTVRNIVRKFLKSLFSIYS